MPKTACPPGRRTNTRVWRPVGGVGVQVLLAERQSQYIVLVRKPLFLLNDPPRRLLSSSLEDPASGGYRVSSTLSCLKLLINASYGGASLG